ncbi:MAG: hypothetical protein ACKPKO_22570, partial [Candidatus Fonsibacter sp.]
TAGTDVLEYGDDLAYSVTSGTESSLLAEQDDFWDVDQEEIAVASNAHNRMGCTYGGRPAAFVFHYMKDRGEAKYNKHEGAKDCGKSLGTVTHHLTESEQLTVRAAHILSVETSAALSAGVTPNFGQEASQRLMNMWVSLERCIKAVEAGQWAMHAAQPVISGMCESMDSILATAVSNCGERRLNGSGSSSCSSKICGVAVTSDGSGVGGVDA